MERNVPEYRKINFRVNFREDSIWITEKNGTTCSAAYIRMEWDISIDYAYLLWCGEGISRDVISSFALVDDFNFMRVNVSCVCQQESSLKVAMWMHHVCQQESSLKVVVSMHHVLINKKAVEKLWC